MKFIAFTNQLKGNITRVNVNRIRAFWPIEGGGTQLRIGGNNHSAVEEPEYFDKLLEIKDLPEKQTFPRRKKLDE